MKKFRMILRGMGELHRLSPWNLLAKCVRSFCNAAIPFANLYMSAMIIDALTQKQSLRYIGILVLLTVGVDLVLVLISKEMDAINYRKWNQFYLRYNFSIGEKAQSLSYADIENPDTHVLIKNLDDAMKISNYGLIKLHSRIPLFVENLFKVLFSLGLITAAIVRKADSGWVNTWYADILLIVLVMVSAWACIVANKRIASKSYDHLGRLSKSNRIFDYYMTQYLDSHKAGKDIRLYGQDRLITDEILQVGEKNTKIVDSMNRSIFANNLWISAANFALIFYTYLFIGLKSIAGVYAVGSIVKYSGGVLQFAAAFSGMMDAFSQLRANSRYLSDYLKYRDLPESAEASGITEKIEQCEIEVDDVSFRYPGTSEFVLKNVSFRIHNGDTTAIVGRNGSGKTTMIKLLCRLYEPTSGEIRLNGISIQEYDEETYRAMLGVVFQDFKLFSFTLGQNIAQAVSYDASRVQQCLKEAGMEERLHRMPAGLESHLYKDFAEDGVEISGGEAQKIALARALYKDAPFIILDEPTAALDPLAEAEIYENFNALIENKTAIYISHRMSSCKFCDSIVVMKEGTISELGNHAELLSRNGEYAALYNAQAAYYR